MINMSKWKIVAYPDEENFPIGKKEKIVEAISRREAMQIAWRDFPEYHEIGVYAVKEE